MKKALFITVTLLFCQICFSNNQKLDSLTSLLIKANDLDRANILIELSNTVVYSQTPEALKYAKEALQLAVNAGNDTLKYAALKAMGYANGYLGNFDVSLQNMKEGLVYYEQIADSVKIAEAYSDIAYLLQALSSSDENIMEYNLRALSIREKIGDQKGIAYSLNNIGAIYWQWEKYDKAIDYFLKAIPYFEKLNLIEEIAVTTGNIGTYYNKTKDYIKAKSYLSKALLKYRLINHKNGEAKILTELARLSNEKGDIQTALELNNEAKLIREKIGDRQGLISNYYNIGNVLYSKGNYKQAEIYLLKSLELANEIGLIHSKIEICQVLSELNVKTKNYQAAFEYLQQSKTLNDSIFSVEKLRQLEEIRSKYDIEKKEVENKQLQIENENQKLVLERNKLAIYLLLGGALLAFVIMFLIFQRNQTKMQLKAVISEQRLLRSQMNPHFIFNAITAIQSYIFTHSPKEAVHYLSSFAILMRQILESSRKEFVMLDTELQVLKNYFKLQQLRYPGKFNYTIEIDEEIDPGNTLIPPMLNQPLIENAIEHGLNQIDYIGEILIKYQQKENSLQVEITDNGIGILKGNDRNNIGHQSFAIMAIKERLQTITKRKKFNFHFEIIDKSTLQEKQSGTIVRYSIPCKCNI